MNLRHNGSILDGLVREFGEIYSRDTLARVAWSTIAEPGDTTIGAIVATYGAVEALERAQTPAKDGSENELAACGHRLDESAILGALATTVEDELVIVSPDASVWPSRIDRLRHASPLLLWVRGDPALMTSKLVAITGTRRPSEEGRRIAKDRAREFVMRRWTVASGGSYGIDAAAHLGALDAGGRTVALLASGLEVLFPSGNAGLLTRIGSDGALVSERAPGTAPRDWRFQRRNLVLQSLARLTEIVDGTGFAKTSHRCTPCRL